MMRENHNFDIDMHNSNIQRRIMEREFTLNSPSNKQNNQNQNVDYNENFGEITGDLLDGSNLDKGMPFRPKMNITTQRYSNDNFEDDNQNTHLDFNLYDSKPNIKVSYYDPFSTQTTQVGYSNINSDFQILKQSEYNKPEFILSDITNAFTYDFIHQFTEVLNSKKSLLLSPFNILQSFILLYIGSKNNTEKELKSYFSLPDKKTTFSTMLKINQYLMNTNIFTKLNVICIPTNITLNDAYVSYVNKLGNFIKINSNEPMNESFTLNKIIENSTNGLIKNIIQPYMINKNQQLILINTIYFYSKWKYQFDPGLTKNEKFNGIQIKSMPMMIQYNIKHRYFEDTHNQILEMDYADDLFTMGIVLPKSQYNNPMITYDQFKYYTENLKETYLDIVKIPKFRQETKYKIDNLFKKYGLREIFTNADLSDMIPKINNHPTNINEIIHASIIIINEAGIKNGTSNTSYNSSSYKKINFIANHQFLYYIRFKPYNILLFIGVFY
jgi:serine protease inhibitor